ncbi:hypothetical protein KBX37_16360 [Micromonospora sp. U56]|uniref:hypothetical protein n=1 Tax=Micromonospora sp. U56 TaxID=2824900 RepID=UPI001B38B3AE|nr:hypothetical protein [Micromonospora sp. U56]MBQ0894652.1 hypothetical protein [Micromonospora sp. U56]
MNPWITAAAALFGVVVGVVGKYLADLRAGRNARLLDEKLKQAVRFFEAADQARRTQQGVATATISFDNARQSQSSTPAVVEDFRTKLTESRERARVALMDAEKVYTAVRLLVPEAAGSARTYLDLCHEAWQPDDKADARKRALETAEAAIRRGLGA